MQPQNSGSQGFRFGSIIIHSLWITLTGILLFRIATANTQSVVYVKIFGISGAILATGPWIIHFLVSTTIIVLYKAQVYDLTWLVKPPSEGGSCCWNSRAEDGDIKYDTWTSNGNGNAHRRINGHGRSNIGDNFRMLVPVDATRGPQLQRNRTI
ncbi:hypothetical protein CUMW_035540 [Citrus unshiu]|nr:hypothetical protein CUMW_035540 [Citrus unshiu]